LAIIDRMKSAWNAFIGSPATGLDADYSTQYGAPTYAGGQGPSRPRRFVSNDRTIVTAIYNRISIDVASIAIKHIQLDESGRFKEEKDSFLNSCLTLEPNMDQGPRAFRQDIVLTLFDKGVAALVPVDTTLNPNTNEVVDIFTLRVGEITKWGAEHVTVSAWNEKIAQRQEVRLKKRFVSIVENPLYPVMNAPNSTLQRLIRKLALLDAVDEQSASGKLDLIIQLPYMIKTEARKQQAEQRREQIETQLKGSKYGIAYTDGTEKITQLNRPAENNLMTQIDYLTEMLYNQLGITKQVMDGTADEATMINYFNRTVEPIATAIVEAMQRAFLGPVQTKKGERILFFKDPFKLVPVAQIAEIADKFTRNEVLTSNEIRGYMGIPPSTDPKADKLNNSNMPDGAQVNLPVTPPVTTGTPA
jgi:hypothetical protein